jgi:hypothetical protein
MQAGDLSRGHHGHDVSTEQATSSLMSTPASRRSANNAAVARRPDLVTSVR